MRSRTACGLSIAMALGIITAMALQHWPQRMGEAASVRSADRLDFVAIAVAYEAQLAAGSGQPTTEHLAAIRSRLPALAFADRRVVYLSDRSGFITASTAVSADSPTRLADLLGSEDTEPTGTSGSVIRTTLRDGTPVLAAFRSLTSGYVAVVQPRSAVSAERSYPPYASEAFAFACATALAGLTAGCLRYRRRALNAKRDRRRIARQFDTSLAHGRCGLWDWDTTRNRVFWSSSMYELLGYEPRGDHLSVGEITALLHPEDGGMRMLADALSTAAALDRELRVRTAGGDWLWLRIKGEVVIDPIDGSRHIVGLAADVSADRQAAERRAKDDRRLRDAVEAISEAFVLWDAEERLILCNTRFLKLHGIPAHLALPGTPARQIMTAGRPAMAGDLLPLDLSGSTGGRTVERQLPDGRWVHVSEQRTRDGGVVSVGIDVSEHKRKEARLRERERHLQGSVRRAETAAQCYAAAAERNYEANLAKTQFLSRMSHELRTPLTAIIGFSDVMRQQLLGPIDTRYVSYTNDIHASGLKLLQVIDGILQMTRIEKGQFALSPEVMLLDDVVGDAIEAIREDAAARRITIEIDTLGPILIQADAQGLREVLVQLLRNAVTFSGIDACVRIRLRTAGERINIFVEDRGIGIPSDILPRLGRPFEQVESEYCRNGGGAGLGLSIAQALVDMHDGTLKLRSEPGIGTIAMVHLPKLQPAANDRDAPSAQLNLSLIAAE
ncbi:sensor histidine kinase [Enterovirga rhinocerotis]|nr:ATP-binding protein [Enterovirga rhinocerotis]